MRQLHKAIRFIFTAENVLLEKLNQSNGENFKSVVEEMQRHAEVLAKGIKFSYSYMSEEATEFIPANQTMDQKAFVIKGYTNAIQKRSSSVADIAHDFNDMISMYSLAHEIAIEKNELGIAKFISDRLDTYQHHLRLVTDISQEAS
jgi:hypothetical protein